MGVRTTADGKLDNAKDHLSAAIKDLSEIVIDKCYGHDEWNSEYRNNIKKAFLALLEIEDLLGQG